MIAWISGLIGVLCFISATGMFLFGGWLNDFVLWLTLWGACSGIAVGSTVLWALRKSSRSDPPHRIQRNQARAGIFLSSVTIVLIYSLMSLAKPTEKPANEDNEAPSPVASRPA